MCVYDACGHNFQPHLLLPHYLRVKISFLVQIIKNKIIMNTKIISSMEIEEDIVIVGAGIAGLTTALGLHRLGVKSLVLESADSLRVTGFALGLWANAWKALDVLGIGEIIREKHTQLIGIVATSVDSGLTTSRTSIGVTDSEDNGDTTRCVNRNFLLKTLESELPKGAVRYSSKVVRLETFDSFNLIHLADGTIIKSKVLIGCDGVNSVVAKFLGFSKPSFTSRLAVRSLVRFEDGHGFEPNGLQFYAKGVRYGVIPSDDQSLYWFFSFTPSSPQEKELEGDLAKMKQFVLSKLGKVPDNIRAVFEKTDLNSMDCSPLKFRYPWDVLWGNISKGGVCVAGDALHPMTPDIAQGGCAALEDGIVLARVLGEVFNRENYDDEKDRHIRIQKALEKFANERRWRSFDLMTTSYLVGYVTQSDGFVLSFIRDKFMRRYVGQLMMNKTTYDCGKLKD